MKHMRRNGSAAVRTVVVATIILAGIGILRGSEQPPARRILFIGNSLTSANDVPGLVEALSASGGARIDCRVVAFPNYSLEDHWNRGDAMRSILGGGWSVVVLQQGPSALPESRTLLIDYARRFDAAIKKVGARTALYMVWPAANRRGDFDGVSASYAAAAHAVGGLLLPVGEAWRAVLRRDPSIDLYASDGFHPTAVASYLAALVIYQKLSGRSPIGLPATMVKPRLAEARAALLQEAAAEVNAAKW